MTDELDNPDINDEWDDCEIDDDWPDEVAAGWPFPKGPLDFGTWDNAKWEVDTSQWTPPDKLTFVHIEPNALGPDTILKDIWSLRFYRGECGRFRCWLSRLSDWIQSKLMTRIIK